MKKKSAVHLCLAGGIVLLVAQLSLLGLLLFPFNLHHQTFLKDVETLVNISSKLHMPVFAVDSEVLQHFRNLRNDLRSRCVMCEAKNPATFVTLFAGLKQSDEFVFLLQEARFHVVSLQNTNPSEVPSGISMNVPICYLLKRNIVIHLVLFHEREGSYWWHGNLLSDPRAISELSAFGLSVHGIQMMKTEGAFDKFETEVVHMDGIPLLVPKDIPRFLLDASSSRFIECSHTLADSFYRSHGRDVTHEALRFVHKAWKLLSKVKTLLDKLGVKFWICSGTCLGTCFGNAIVSLEFSEESFLFLTMPVYRTKGLPLKIIIP